MIEIDDKIVSTEVITAKFACDISVCRGECCVDGNSGAPLDDDEELRLKETFDAYKKYLKPEGLRAIEAQGFAVLDMDGDLTTPLIDDAECAYSIDEKGGTWCAIEKAYVRGETDFRKPISCHLYPIRLTHLSNGYTGLQYHRWKICRCAEIKGAGAGMPLYVSLREAIERRFGATFYEQLDECAKYIEKEDEIHATYNR